MLFEVRVETLHQIPKCFPVMTVDQMANLMDNDVIDDLVRRHDQFAIEVQVIFVGAAAPDGGDAFESDPLIAYV